MESQSRTWLANWIWVPGETKTVNFHCFARKEFSLPGPVTSAQLYITAMTDYQLYVNGQFVRRGPTWGDPAFQSYDVHDVAALLNPGLNVIGVICHNYGVGTHWQYAGPGGLFCQLEIEAPIGQQVLASGPDWKVLPGAPWQLDSPRAFWSCGFVEIFDARSSPTGWLEPGFDDSAWLAPHVYGPHPTRPWQRLTPRVIPFLRETPESPASLEKGTFNLQGVHIVRFDSLLSPRSSALVYAETEFYSPQDRDLLVQIECDDACKAFWNGALLCEQSYNFAEARTKLWRGYDEYDQVHFGMHLSMGAVKTPLQVKAGWNRLTIAIDHGAQGWGTAVAFLDPQTAHPTADSEHVVSLPFRSAGQDARWTLVGPFPSTGLSDSLDDIAQSIAALPAGTRRTWDPFDFTQVTDIALLMHFEQRALPSAQPLDVPMTLFPGEYCIYDLGRVKVGYPRFEISAEADTVVDIGYNQVFFDDRRIRACQGGSMRNVDRLYLPAGQTTWAPFQRRTGRYIHISCRQGQFTLHLPTMCSVGYPVELRSDFACSDDLLNRVWETSVYTSRLLMQYGYQDCLKREQGTCNTYQASYQALAAAYAFGDFGLARKNLVFSLQTQQDDGWFHGHGPSSPNQDETTLILFWWMWLHSYYTLSGDRELVEQVFDQAEDSLRWFAKAENRHGLIDSANLIVSRPGQLAYIDDLQCSGAHLGHFSGELVAFNILYYGALQAAEDLAAALGRADRASYYHRKAQRAWKGVRDRFWVEEEGLYADWRMGDQWSSERCPIFQVAALDYGLADADQAQRLMDYLLNHIGLPLPGRKDYPLYTFNYYNFLNVLFENNADRAALDLMRCYFGAWVQAGGDAFDEHCSPARIQNNRIDFEYEVHGYGTSAHAHFYTHILGIQPLEPGFRRILIQPRPGDLAWARGKAATPQGLVEVSWSYKDGTFILDITGPDVEYEVKLPSGVTRATITINGKQSTP
jgi:alpha-L-rhamnosidase